MGRAYAAIDGNADGPDLRGNSAPHIVAMYQLDTSR
jgi:hypothetical protein